MLFLQEIEVEFLLVGLYSLLLIVLMNMIITNTDRLMISGKDLFYLTCWHFV